MQCGNTALPSVDINLVENNPPTTSNNPCLQNSAIKHLKIYFHFVSNDDGTGNFNQIGDGNGNYEYNGYKRAEDLLNIANYEMSQNNNMWLPKGNNTPKNPTNIRYILGGVFFHCDSKLGDFKYNVANDGQLDALDEKYGIDRGKVINYYFCMNNSSDNALRGLASGIGGKLDIKGNRLLTAMSLDYNIYKIIPGWQSGPASNINHEIGHLLNLYHTSFSDDECSDTPRNSGCWTYNDRNENCKDWNTISNNLMDYNEFFVHAISPCQIERMQNLLLQKQGGVAYISGCGSILPTNAFFDLVYSTGYPRDLYLEGSSSVNETHYRYEICEVSSENAPACISGSYSSG